jgi:hypothetical protein
MVALLWLIAAVVELGAVTAYEVLGAGVAFWVLEAFVLLTFALVILELAIAARRAER